MSSELINADDTNHSKSDSIRPYSPQQIAAATFLGSSAAGGILLAENFSRLGRTGAAILSGVGGVVVTALVIVLAMNMSDSISGMPFIIAQTMLMLGVAQLTQGEVIKQHLADGGELAQGWRPVLITLGTVAVLVVAVCAVFAIV